MRFLARLHQELAKNQMLKKPKVMASKSLSNLYWCNNAPLSPEKSFEPTMEEFLDSLGLISLYKKFVHAGLDDYKEVIFLMNTDYPITDELLQKEIGVKKIGYRHRLLSRLNEEAGVKRSVKQLKIENEENKSACECLMF